MSDFAINLGIAILCVLLSGWFCASLTQSTLSLARVPFHIAGECFGGFFANSRAPGLAAHTEKSRGTRIVPRL